MMSTYHTKIEFNSKTRKVWDKATAAYKEVEFFRLEMIDDYNHKMDGIDLQDQLRWYYRTDGKHMWRSQRWTWAMYRWVINTRVVQAYLLHVLLTKKAQELWDAELSAKIDKEMKGPASKRRRELWTQRSRKEAEKVAKEAMPKPRPKPLTHKAFRLDVMYGLFGKPECCALAGRRKSGRPSKKRPIDDLVSHSSYHKGILSSPDREEKRQRNYCYSSTKKGTLDKTTKRLYSKSRLNAGEGLPQNRFTITPGLDTHAAWDFEDANQNRATRGVRKKHGSTCQICRCVGPVWDGRYRGGTKKPRQAKITCSCIQCPKAYCSLYCFNLWHRGQEMPEATVA